MQLARVRGTVVCTQKLPSLRGSKLLVLEMLDENGQPLPHYEVAADLVGAGRDEWVLVSRGSAARVEPGQENNPIDAMVIGIIDTVTIGNQQIYNP
ncbi:MAG: EutN/CcmL family microcompartment protein [Coleofasciculaceae cyanobacterium RL_1_1]|nr:EutN/CcmL family microcompartment protein [Coleofasciculaceae cyanobacterium RL_1_1]